MLLSEDNLEETVLVSHEQIPKYKPFLMFLWASDL